MTLGSLHLPSWLVSEDASPDVQTPFLLSTSTLTWLSGLLYTLKNFKVFPLKQLTLSNKVHYSVGVRLQELVQARRTAAHVSRLADCMPPEVAGISGL